MHLQTNFLSIQKQSVNVVFQLLNLTLAVFKMADNIFKIFESNLRYLHEHEKPYFSGIVP